VMTQLHHIKRVLYVDGIYLEEIKKLAEQNANYQIQQMIQNADWRDVQRDTILECESFPKSMSAERFIRSMDLLDSTLQKVQRDGMARSSDAQIGDSGRVQALLGISNKRLADQQPRTLSDNYRLNTEQNIHLLVKYLESVAEGKDRLPAQSSLYNPAALYDMAEAAQLLLKTYRNTQFYFGTPEEPTVKALNHINQGIEGYETLLKSFAEMAPVLIDDYVKELRTFTEHYVKYQDHRILKYYMEQIHPRLEKEMQEAGMALTGMDIGKRSEFFRMDGPNWFVHLWNHFYPAENRWSGMGWDAVSTKHPDRPTWVPKNRIGQAKDRYRDSHQAPAEKIHKMRVAEYENKARGIEGNAHLRNPHFKNAILRWILTDKFTIAPWEWAPYQFFNEKTVLPVTDWHLKQLPKSVFAAHALGIGDLQFTWREAGDGYIELKASLKIKSNPTIELFKQTVPLHGSQKVGLLESLHYTWFGGHLPSGNCDEFDLDLNHYVVSPATQDYADYGAGKANYDCPEGRCHHPGYRATICYPKTEEVQGMIHGNTLQKNGEAFSHLPIDVFSEEDAAIIDRAIEQELKQVRDRIVQEMSHLFRTQNPKVLNEDVNLPDGLKNDFLQSYNRLSVKGTSIKMVLSYLINPNDLKADMSWPNIFVGEDILREHDQYSGQRVFLDTLLKQIAAQLEKAKPAIVEAIQEKPVEQYPFTKIKAEFEKTREETEKKHLMNNFYAESKPQNALQFAQIVPLLKLFPEDVKNQMALINPPLQPFFQAVDAMPQLLPPRP